MTTPEQIIAKIEEIEKMLPMMDKSFKLNYEVVMKLLEFKQSVIQNFNLPTADSPEGSPGQEDMKN